MKHLTLEQRYEISAMYKLGLLQKGIAKSLNKDKSTIYRELSSNCDKRSGNYAPKLAQKKCDERHKEKPKKIHFISSIKQYVYEWINEEYSPEQIAGRALLLGDKCVSAERIYQYIYGKTKKQWSIIFKVAT